MVQKSLFLKGLVFCVCSFIFLAPKVFAYRWPSLYTPDDFIPQNKKDVIRFQKQRPDHIYKMSPTDIQKQIDRSFYFFADLESGEQLESPQGWFQAQKDPQRALIAGFPDKIKRNSLKFYLPVYNLTKLFYFISDDPHVSELNTCQRLWAEKRHQNAFDCFFFLQLSLAKENFPVHHVLRIQVNALHGFFLLYLASNQEKEVFLWNEKVIPPLRENEPSLPSDYFSISRQLFSYISTKTNDSLFLPTQKEKVDPVLYKSLFASPQFFKKTEKIFGETVEVSFHTEPIDPLLWIKTVMPFIYANTVTMSQMRLLWERGFVAAEKFKNYIQKLDLPLTSTMESPLQFKKKKVLADEVFLAPQTINDLLVCQDLFAAHAFILGKDPFKALDHLSFGILKKGHPDLSSFLFALSGDLYFDFGIFRLAKRSYSWAELYSKSFSEKIQAPVFFGAESAFWMGKDEVAQKGFERFQNLVGDPVYGPWALLRLAEIAEKKGKRDRAQINYENLLKNFDHHPASQDAQVRLFCLYQNRLSEKVKRVEYEKVLEKIKNSRQALKKQAKACLLFADLESLKKSSITDNTKNILEKTELQKNLIKQYTQEFQNSEFIPLFAKRLQVLELAEGTFLAANHQCVKLLSYYKKHKTALNRLRFEKFYVQGLKWDHEDRLKVLRCSAFLRNISLWEEMRKNPAVGKDGEPLQSIFYHFVVYPSVNNALAAYRQFKKSTESWKKKIQLAQKSKDEIINRPDFWEMFVLRELVKYQFLMSQSARTLLDHAVAQDLFQEPSLILSSDTLCRWMLKSTNFFDEAKWDAIGKLKSSEEWVTLMLANEKKSLSCEGAFAKHLLARALQQPNIDRDQKFLKPYLQKQGVAQAGEHWLRFAQRLEQERGKGDVEIRNIYEKIKTESTSFTLQEAARLWIQKNTPQDFPELLW